MEEAAEKAVAAFYADQHWLLLGLSIGFLLLALGKAADWLVSEAVVLSERSGLPKVVIGATVVSLGTTTPEAAVSVLAAISGRPDVALGNAVGSVICDTGLILGLACLFFRPHVPRKIVNRQGWVQLGAGVLLVALSTPWSDPGSAFDTGGVLSQRSGMLLVFLLGGYLWLSVYWAKHGIEELSLEEFEADVGASSAYVVMKMIVALGLVVISSWLLIPAVEEAAERLEVPQAVVAATLVAFGTSLPELVVVLTASAKGHGDLAVGNVIGADVLNVLFVAGTSAAVTAEGLVADPAMFTNHFPAMLLVLVVFRIGVSVSGDRFGRGLGVALLAVYLVSTVMSFAAKG